jgi:hypothetical protein
MHHVTLWRVRVTTVAADTQQYICVVVVVELHDTVNFANAPEDRNIVYQYRKPAGAVLEY